MLNWQKKRSFSGKVIEVVLANPQSLEDQISLFYKLYAKPISDKYFFSIKEMEERNVPLIDRDRFYHFPGCYKNKKWVEENINLCIRLINEFKADAIPHKVEGEICQDLLNKLHHYFELYRGSILKPGKFYLSAPENVQKALNDFNLLIHRYESLIFMEEIWRKYQVTCPQGVFCYETDKRIRKPMSDEDFSEFTYDNVFGSIILNYCELGKPILDAFHDRDTHVGNENIRPLQYYSGDAMINFSKTTTRSLPGKIFRSFFRAHPKGLKKWWKYNYHRVENLTPDINNPRNALGFIVLGELDRSKAPLTNLSDSEVVELISKYLYFQSVHALEGKIV